MERMEILLSCSASEAVFWWGAYMRAKAMAAGKDIAATTEVSEKEALRLRARVGQREMKRWETGERAIGGKTGRLMRDAILRGLS
jgi:hypothetical protein